MMGRVALVLMLGCGMMAAQEPKNLMRIDASAAMVAPEPVQAKLGTAVNQKGDVIGVNSQYLTMNGKPWLPVMGEFHFSRYPEAEWEEEILKMKSAGVQIVSTYIIWIHHEQTEGKFDWSGQKDLRRFVELCGKHGMYVYPRIGPWAHAEVRNGGLPDWVLKNGPTRQNDPVYLKEVGTFYAEIAKQLKGELWKDGGPVIGLQVENEYRARGAGKGDEHIRTLKQMAIDDGLDVPLYTVTGWDGASIPLDAVLPVFGGYPDAPWDGSPKKLPPNEVYAFRFANRSGGNMGAIGGRGQSPASVYRGTPFFTAEVGDGIEDTYFRRPVVSADDVAAIPSVMLGSGANLLGYYMFHGGRNPDGGDITLQESQVTGYPTDVPTRSYDFQAPLGEFGQVRQSLRKLKLVHYFLNDFGAMLAPMEVRPPAKLPADPADASMARVSARTNGDAGFVFVSNYVRGLEMPDRDGFQVELKLPSGVAKVPAQPLKLAAGAYGIWPVNLKVGTATLRYSTAQLFKRVEVGGETYLFFFAIPKVRPEFAFDDDVKVDAAGVARAQGGGLVRLMPKEGETAELKVGGVHLVVLPESKAESVWRVDDPAELLLAAGDAYSDGSTWTMLADDENKFAFEVFGAKSAPVGKDADVHAAGRQDGMFAAYNATVPAVHLTAALNQVHAAGALEPPKFGRALSWRKNPVPLAPDDADFAKAAEWKIAVPAVPKSATLADAFLAIGYEGDAARLYEGKVVDDNFWNGLPWTVGLREVDPEWQKQPREFTLRVVPLNKTHGTYLELGDKLHFNGAGLADAVTSIRVVPEYRLVVSSPAER